MKNGRLLLLLASLALSVLLAFALRRTVHDFFVVPLSYVIWQVGVLMGAVPELVRWVIIVVVLGLVIAWQLIPDLKPFSPRSLEQGETAGQVEGLANWLAQARASNYFKWQLAHRLGCLSRRLDELAGRKNVGVVPRSIIARYLDAGLNHSFVDFSVHRRLFERPSSTPLDIDPAEVIEFLESQSFIGRGNHVDSL